MHSDSYAFAWVLSVLVDGGGRRTQEKNEESKADVSALLIRLQCKIPAVFAPQIPPLTVYRRRPGFCNAPA